MRSRVTVSSASSAGRNGPFEVFPQQPRLPACATAGLEVQRKSTVSGYRLADVPNTPVSAVPSFHKQIAMLTWTNYLACSCVLIFHLFQVGQHPLEHMIFRAICGSLSLFVYSLSIGLSPQNGSRCSVIVAGRPFVDFFSVLTIKSP
ncbi:hypothetical protein GGI43DRAFT_120519 [Trichoderma evansii]